MKASADLRSLERRRIVAALPKFQVRNYASKSSADQIVEDIQEQYPQPLRSYRSQALRQIRYATARDEFEIAAEETQKKSIYAADDRAAAREELTALKELYEKALEGTDGDEVKRRVGQRIRELDTAVEELNKADYED